jgi:hypothetical protein
MDHWYWVGSSTNRGAILGKALQWYVILKSWVNAQTSQETAETALEGILCWFFVGGSPDSVILVGAVSWKCAWHVKCCGSM